MYVTVADSIAWFTLATTPSILFGFFSIRTEQDAQVIPPIVSPTAVVGVAEPRSVPAIGPPFAGGVMTAGAPSLFTVTTAGAHGRLSGYGARPRVKLQCFFIVRR